LRFPRSSPKRREYTSIIQKRAVPELPAHVPLRPQARAAKAMPAPWDQHTEFFQNAGNSRPVRDQSLALYAMAHRHDSDTPVLAS